MSETVEYPKLKYWVLSHNKISVQCTDFTNTRNIQNAWSALSDLQKLLQNETDEAIMAYFSQLKQELRESSHEIVDDDEMMALEKNWVAPTD